MVSSVTLILGLAPFFFKFIYFERERGKERIPNSLHAISKEKEPDVGPDPMNHEIMT